MNMEGEGIIVEVYSEEQGDKLVTLLNHYAVVKKVDLHEKGYGEYNLLLKVEGGRRCIAGIERELTNNKIEFTTLSQMEKRQSEKQGILRK